MYTAIAIIAAYLIGSLPTAYIVGRVRKGVDIRTVGSRNMGAMNVGYQVGAAEGVFVVFVDIAKGMLAVAVAGLLVESLAVRLAAGVIVVLGHAFPIWLGFRGGKGGATCIGVLGLLIPWGIPFYLGLFVAAVAITRYLTFSYSFAFLAYPFTAWLAYDSATLVVYSLLLVLVPGIKYLPRIREMHATAGSWRGVVFRSSLKDRI